MKINNLTKNIILTPFNILYKINPRLELKILFRLKVGYKLNFNNPITINEKVQWIKLYDRNSLMPKCSDKYLVRKYIEEKGLKNILNDLLWEGFNPEDIPFSKLPNKFVIKATHGSTFNIICEDKSKLDRNLTIKKLKKWLKVKFIPCYGEWFYGLERPRIIVEKFIESKDSLKDYKVYCFNGKPKFISVFSERFSGQMKQEMYDLNWNNAGGKTSFCPDPKSYTPKPKNLKQMIDCAKILSKDFNFVRVDFYNEENNLLFGELTFTMGAGFDKCSSYEFDKKLGSYLKLPIK